MVCIYALILAFSMFCMIGCLQNAPHLMLDMCFEAAEAALHADSQIAVLKCVHCQNLHVDTTPTTITSKIFVSALYVVKLV